MPSIGALEARYGSLVGGGLQMMKGRHHSSGEPEGRLFSFREGMAAIPARAGTATRLGDPAERTRVTRIAAAGPGWSVTSDRPSGRATQHFDAVICAAPTHVFPQVEFVGEAEATVGGARGRALRAGGGGGLRVRATATWSHPLDGFGVLVPAVERRRTLGTLFSSTLFPGRAPEGFVTLTTFLGGERQPDIARASEATIADAADADLRDLLGARGTPAFRRVEKYARAIPQYGWATAGSRKRATSSSAPIPASCWREVTGMAWRSATS